MHVCIQGARTLIDLVIKVGSIFPFFKNTLPKVPGSISGLNEKYPF